MINRQLMGEDFEESGNGVLGLVSRNLAGRTYKKPLKSLCSIALHGPSCLGEGREGARGEVAPGGKSPRGDKMNITNANFGFSEPNKFQIIKPKRRKFNK